MQNIQNIRTPVRTLWAKVLHEVKTFTERRIPNIDMAKLWEGFASVRGVKLIDAAAVSQIKELVNLLKSFGTVEDRFSESHAEERSKFTENMVGLAEWFQADFKPGLQQANELLTMWTASRKEDAKDGMSMALLAEEFSPI